jgi:ABC-type glutathione transport system ATPase component
MTKIEIRARALPRENAVLRRLYFDTMYSREDNISMAESGTFKWMLGEQDAASSRSSISGSVATESQSNSQDEDEAVDDSRTDIAEPFSAPDGEENSNQGSPSASETEEPFSPPEGERHLSQSSSLASEDQVDESSIVQASSLDPSPELDMRESVANSFLSFIEHDNGILFISGKAGSGKSTLMKFLGDHDRVKALAESWAGEKTLVFAPFYFWNSGDRLQMSLEGCNTVPTGVQRSP